MTNNPLEQPKLVTLPEGYGDAEGQIFENIFNINKEFVVDTVIFYYKQKLQNGTLTFDQRTRALTDLGLDFVEYAMKKDIEKYLNHSVKEN